MLPQFTLNARIIFFMMVMVVFATTACSKKTNDYVIMLKYYEKALNVDAAGKVTATDAALAQYFTMESVGDILSETIKIALYVKEVGRYLCFRKGKLVGMKHLNPDCHFIESLDHGYFLYANAYNPLWRVGFTRNLKPVGPRHLQRPQSLRRASFLFDKIRAEHFDRNMFTTTTTTTTTTAPPTTTTIAPQNTMQSQSHHGQRGIHRLRESQLAPTITIEDNVRNVSSKQRAGNGGAQAVEELEHQQRRRQRKRKHHNKLAASGNSPAAASPQPKNLVRHHQTTEERRRKFQREEHERKRRLHNQRKRKQIESQDNLAPPTSESSTTPPPPPPPPPFASSSSSASASASVTATSLAATASLAPSALNIVAMLAASRRKKGRRKKQGESADSSSNTQATATGAVSPVAAMDLQLVAQVTPPAAPDQYDTAAPAAGQSERQHEHNYHQRRPAATPENNVQPQNHKYSNSTTKDSHLSSRRSSNHSRSHKTRPSITYSHSHSHSHTDSHSRSLSHSHSNLNDDDNVDDVMNTNTNTNTNTNVNLNVNVNHNNVNAIPALPKNFNMSPEDNSNNNHNNPQQYFNVLTDFKTKRMPSHSQTSRATPSQPSKPPTTQQRRHPANAAKLLRRHKRDLSLIHSSTSQRRRNSLNGFLQPIKVEQTSDGDIESNASALEQNVDNGDDAGDNDNDNENASHHHHVGVKSNSNRLLGNSNHVREDNNFQHQQHLLVERLKLIYLNRISNDTSSNSKSKNHSKTTILNNTNNKRQQSQSQQLSNNYENGRIDSSATTIFRYIKKPINVNGNANNRIGSSSSTSHSLSRHDKENVNIRHNDTIISNDLNNKHISVQSKRNGGGDGDGDGDDVAAANVMKTFATTFQKRIFFGQNVYRRRQPEQPLQRQQRQQVIDDKFITNNNNYNNVHSTYGHDGNDVNVDVNNNQDDNDDDDDDEKFKQNEENKYEKIIVQYRSVVDLFRRHHPRFLTK